MTLTQPTEQLTHSVHFDAAWDKRNADPAKNYGIHGVQIRFVTTGQRGAVQFTLFTNWILPHVEAEYATNPIVQRNKELFYKPQPASVDYHSYAPIYEGQDCVAHCDLLGGKPCYCDGSCSYGDTVFKALVAEGEDALWKLLDDYYEQRLSKLEPIAEAI